MTRCTHINRRKHIDRRYIVAYGDRYGSPYLHCVYDQNDRRVEFSSDSKSEVIAKAQTLNGFQPIDGDENTYGKQIETRKRVQHE